MKKKESLKGLSKQDLQSKLNEASLALEKLKFAHAVSPIENPAQIRYAKKSVARLKTELTSK
ncbi:MAG TPA: 50S ribosomal protein L29 [Cytophagaceae bacterium]|jgi:large subunit ribosomal protein L29|nr:50S ribosomal protein L29 [Cytophagaceae bacterium]